MSFIEILDSSLRDGAQSEGINYSLLDKIKIIQALDLLGVSYIEAGNPESGPKDRKLYDEIRTLPLSFSKVAAFGSTRRKNVSAADDEGLRALAAAGTEVVVIFGKSWRSQVEKVLQTTPEENLKMISESVRFLKDSGKKVFFDAEHFFDGYFEDPQYAEKTLEAAFEEGAERLVLCDTRGGTYPQEVARLTKLFTERFGRVIGVHLHNDTGCAVAGSLAAAEAGAVQIQGTLLGCGERCGNADLCSVIANLQVKMGVSCIPEENMKRLTRTARFIAEVSNTPLAASTPFVGKSAFAHKAGMHAHAVLADPQTYEHIDPQSVGNERRILISEHTGRAAVLERIKDIAPGLSKNSPELQSLTEEIKRLELENYTFEAADASFELLVRRRLGLYNSGFEVKSYKSSGIFPRRNGISNIAQLTVSVGGREVTSSGEGDGPVHALDTAMRNALTQLYPTISTARLTDYKVRVIEPKEATAASVRVLIESSDGRDIWTTVGVSSDIIEASFFALADSIDYLLLKQGIGVKAN